MAKTDKDELREKIQDIWISVSGVKIDAEQIDETIALIDQEKKKFVRQILPEKPVYPEVMEYVKMLKRASENGKYDDMYDNGWKACRDQTIKNMEAVNES